MMVTIFVSHWHAQYTVEMYEVEPPVPFCLTLFFDHDHVKI